MIQKMQLKIHEAERKVVAVCDSELLGKYFEQGKIQLDVKKEFYAGKEMNEKEVLEILQELAEENATFNFVGKQAVNVGIKAGIIGKEGIMRIKNVPLALSL